MGAVRGRDVIAFTRSRPRAGPFKPSAPHPLRVTPAGSRDVDVLLYGATGYTGRLIAHALDARGASFALAGRDRGRLDALAAELTSGPPIFTVDATDEAGLRALAGSARVLLSAAGPFATLGPPLLRAALAAGTHFADITGEQSFLRHAFAQDAAARDAGVTVVNALGFDVVPSDLAATLAVRGMDSVERLDLAIASRGGISGGTRRSMAATVGQGAWYDRGGFRSGPVGRFVRAFDFPEPLGRRTAAFIPWGDVVTAPRSTGARQVRTFFTMPPARARFLKYGWPLLDLALRLPPARARLARRAASAPEGPSPEARRESRFTVLAEATGADGRVQRATVSGRDPYGLTGASAAHGALLLAQGRAPRAGVLTPSQAFDLEAFAREALSPFDVAWDGPSPAA